MKAQMTDLEIVQQSSADSPFFTNISSEDQSPLRITEGMTAEEKQMQKQKQALKNKTMSVELPGLFGMGNSFNLGNVDVKKHDSLATSAPNKDLNTIMEAPLENNQDDLINQLRSQTAEQKIGLGGRFRSLGTMLQ